MFNNIGRKIKVLAKITCWIGIILSIVCGILIIISDASLPVSLPIQESYGRSYYKFSYRINPILLGIVIIVIGSLASWIGSWITYAFGELVENASSINIKLTKISIPNGSVVNSSSAAEKKPCPFCGELNHKSNTYCFRCGKPF